MSSLPDRPRCNCQRRTIGADRSHLKFFLQRQPGAKQLDAIWFNAVDHGEGELPISEGDSIRCAGTLNVNDWSGKQSVQLILSAIHPTVN